MKEPYGEGLASHTGSESCAVEESQGCTRRIDSSTDGQCIEPRNGRKSESRRRSYKRKATWVDARMRARHPKPSRIRLGSTVQIMVLSHSPRRQPAHLPPASPSHPGEKESGS